MNDVDDLLLDLILVGAHDFSTCSIIARMADSGDVSSRVMGTWWGPIVEFGIHTIVGTIIFVLITAPALLLAYLHDRLTFTSMVVGIGFRVGEYGLFGADISLFLVFLMRTTIRSAKKLW